MAARRLHSLIYATIASCCLAIIVCGVALGTNEWFRAEGHAVVEADPSALQVMHINYGLFKGRKVYKMTGGQELNPSDLKVVCLSSEAKCMFSCGTTASKRKQDLEAILSSLTRNEVEICGKLGSRGSSRNLHPFQSEDTNFEQHFLNFALYIMTIAFLAISMAFSALGGALALYNTYRTPIQPIFSVFGLFIWNGISAAAVVLAMVIWGVAYSTALKKNAGVSETLVPNLYASEGYGKLGISFWILILSPILSLANIGLLRYRSWKIMKAEENNIKVMTENLDNGDIILF